MKKVWLILCSIVFVLSLAVGVGAETDEEEEIKYSSLAIEEIDYQNTPLNKLGRGLINAATCWAEVPAEMARSSREKDPVVGSTVGVAQGIITGVIRGLTGVFDAVTFLVPPYNEPIMKPEYALQHADDEISEYLW